MKTCIHQGIILLENGEFTGDIVFEDEKILALGENLVDMADYVVDVSGCYVFAGGIDEHTHFGSFNSCSFETSEAAALGGTTTVVDFVDQEKGQSLKEALMSQQEKAARYPYIDVAFHSMLMDIREEVIEEIQELPGYGVSALKVFTAYKGTPYYADDASILRVMQKIRNSGLLLMVHAENADMIACRTEDLLKEGCIAPKYHADARDVQSEAEMVERMIAYAKWCDIPIFFVHISTKEALLKIMNAKREGQPVFCETCTHYLILNEDDLAKEGLLGARYICSPPLRKEQDQDALWHGIHEHMIEAVSSDHCAVSGGYKKKIEAYHDFSKVPNGAPGVQHRLQMLWSEGGCKQRISKQEFVQMFSSGPADVCGITKKGRLQPGYDADIVIYDPEGHQTLQDSDAHEGIDYATFAGHEVFGKIRAVYLRGIQIVNHNEYIGKGTGRIIKLQSSLCYGYREKDNGQ